MMYDPVCYPTSKYVLAGSQLGEVCTHCGHVNVLHTNEAGCIGCQALLEVRKLITPRLP